MTVEQLKKKAKEYFDLEEYEKSAKACTKLIDYGLDTYYLLRGNCYHELNMGAECISDYNNAEMIAELPPFAYMDRGLHHIDLNNYKNALNDLSHAMTLFWNDDYLKNKPEQLNPIISVLAQKRGIANFFLKNYNAAINDCNVYFRLTKSDYLNQYTYEIMGKSYWMTDQNEKAIQCFTEVLNEDPTFSELYYLRGESYKVLNNYDKAIDDYQNCISNAPHSFDAHSDAEIRINELNAIMKNEHNPYRANSKQSEVQDKKHEGKNLDESMHELNELIGLKRVKDEVNTIVNLIRVKNMREKKGLKQADMSLHLVFYGNPGTGKTTVARILGNIYHSLGVLSKGQLIEVDRSGLVAGYVGQTAIKTQEVIQKALGGILFIDEAYALSSKASESDFGKEAIDTLLKAMEDNRNDLLVIVAGYPVPMEQFLRSNPGLQSRFNTFIHFDDYNEKELYEIFIGLCKKYNYKLTDDANNYLKEYFSNITNNKPENFANAREVRNLFENTMKKQANRLSFDNDITDDELLEIRVKDIL